ncbi:MAG: methylamine utilization protein [Acidobacteria bacterium]|nr:methylamine utilization protein [Acidobacteriota bacterium]
MILAPLRLVGVVALVAAFPAATLADLQGHTRVGDTAEPNAVVWLEAPDAARAKRASRVVLDQRNSRFFPRVLAVQVGTVVDFPNNDRVFHNVFSFHDGKRFDLGLYPIGALKRVQFDRPGLSRIFCNIHPRMAAYLMVVDSPYFAVSDDAGRFTLKDVPEGAYTYHAWRTGGTQVSGPVVVGRDTILEVVWP